MTAPAFTVREVCLYEREVRLRLPFRFGVVTLTEAPQVFVRARIEFPDGRSHWGAAAEMLVPKWFDKDLALSNEENFEQLRLALALATNGYTESHQTAHSVRPFRRPLRGADLRRSGTRPQPTGRELWPRPDRSRGP